MAQTFFSGIVVSGPSLVKTGFPLVTLFPIEFTYGTETKINNNNFIIFTDLEWDFPLKQRNWIFYFLKN